MPFEIGYLKMDNGKLNSERRGWKGVKGVKSVKSMKGVKGNDK
jgi:hypothetical protein